jgi:hypothetical protein
MSSNITEINDIRNTKDFIHCSFSNHKKSEVKTELINNMLLRKLESCCHWTADLICAGHYIFLWEIIFYYLGKYINVGNPKLPIYVLMRFDYFKTIMKKKTFINELDLRNNLSIRQLFVEVICNLSVSNKKPGFESLISLNKLNFNIHELHLLMNSPPTFIDTISDILNQDDPQELFSIFTELSYCLTQNDQANACYWIDWIIQYQIHCIKQKTPIKCFRRENIPVNPNYQTNLICIIWDILLLFSKNKTPIIFNKIIESLMQLFFFQYKPTTTCERRKPLLYFAVSIIIDNIDLNINIISTTYNDKVKLIIEDCDKYFHELKKNEISPKTDYMFMNFKDQKIQNLKKGIAKMEMLANFENR